MPNTQSPVDPITREAVAGALLAIGERQTFADQFAPAAPALAPGSGQASAREELPRVAASPEQRRALAGGPGCSHADLTN